MSADARALGLSTGSMPTVDSPSSTASSEWSAVRFNGLPSSDSGSSSDSSADSTISDTHSHAALAFGKGYYFDSSAESRHSGTGSKNTSGDTNGSNSHGTSQRAG